jgi:Flp pilus assembly protein TadD
MTGPEHYREAERCLAEVDDDSQTAMALLAEAQLHATLALAAATALNQTAPGMTNPDWEAWVDTASAYERLGKEGAA